MEYLDGPDLQRVVELDGPQPPSRVVHILKQVVGALAEAHSLALVHRDVKPANIVLCERGGVQDVAKVVDFGLVKAVGLLAPGLSSDQAMVGTPLFMAPELISDPEHVDARCDIQACGAVAYFLLTGHPVFERGTIVDICRDQLYATPAPLAQWLGRPLPEALERLVLRCLEKRPSDRFASAEELLAALAACDVPEWTASQARTAWARLATRRMKLAAVATAPTLPVTPPPIVAVDLDRRRSSPHGRRWPTT